MTTKNSPEVDASIKAAREAYETGEVLYIRLLGVRKVLADTQADVETKMQKAKDAYGRIVSEQEARLEDARAQAASAQEELETYQSKITAEGFPLDFLAQERVSGGSTHL